MPMLIMNSLSDFRSSLTAARHASSKTGLTQDTLRFPGRSLFISGG